MGFFSNIKTNAIKLAVKTTSRSIFNSLEPVKNSSSWDSIKAAVLRRKGWAIAGEGALSYNHDFVRKVNETDEFSDVAHDVCFIEMWDFINTHDKPNDVIETLLEEIQSFLGLPEAKWEGLVEKKLGQGWYIASLGIRLHN